MQYICSLSGNLLAGVSGRECMPRGGVVMRCVCFFCIEQCFSNKTTDVFFFDGVLYDFFGLKRYFK